MNLVNESIHTDYAVFGIEINMIIVILSGINQNPKASNTSVYML